MRYESTITHESKSVTVQSIKLFAGNWALKDYLKATREASGADFNTIHLRTDISKRRLLNMENGEIPITYEDLAALQNMFKFPRKITKLLDNKTTPIWAVRLKEMRSFHNFTQVQISKALGISQQTYTGYETGKHMPDIDTLVKLADIYKVSADYILGRLN
jgi:transcriptional regulator with XRE-family HTH domain